MAISFKQVKFKFYELIPLVLLLFISLNGNSIIDLKLFSVNIHYILVYYWVLKRPQSLGYGYIFLSGIITDVVFGVPLGVNSLTLMSIAAVATYIRVVTVKVSLFSDWMSFILALLIANFIYFSTLYLSDYSINYLYLFKNSIFTFIFYPFLWGIFGLLLNLTKIESNA
tara:strand:+ start:783 stop:1289 length:507 start_codon:yes stop_codon:yes gene_type:complete